MSTLRLRRHGRDPLSRARWPRQGGQLTLDRHPQDSDWGVQQRYNLYTSGPIVQDLWAGVRGNIYRREASDVLAPGAAQPASARNPRPPKAASTMVRA